MLVAVLLCALAFIILRFALPAHAFGGVTDLLGITRSGSIAVEPMSQLPELPNGCEITSLAVCLRDRGFNVDNTKLAETYLRRVPITVKGTTRYGPDPEDAYAGDPRSKRDAYYCFTKPITQAANAYLRDQGSDLSAHDMSGCSLDDIERRIDEGVPVMVWTTLDASTPPTHSSVSWTISSSGSAYYPYVNLHCMVVAGYDEGRRTLTMCNPLDASEPIDYDIDDFTPTFEALGSRAVAIW
ncbi:hypothetical protein Corgl_0393 [Coriobacterium glomerans PW2]|uniref:Peptidase C39-like domain-containing protein n=1 Tax=Coriobacterium glomerans (strain ATCC 49209 / DSM 20642 / JCM 10262 / PW2) TaxID=700015 RepID=F2NAI4_CORGP|nr:C39 family peptidase [Coriobacterium glomerans]AEB06511.1 hypothetical protein Corgl_0393 [Coriobacterium glomerans PW2]